MVWTRPFPRHCGRWRWSSGASDERLDNEHSSNSLEFAFEKYGLAFESSAAAVALVKEHVAVAALTPRYFARSRDLEPLRGRLVCLDLWHGFSGYLV